MEQNYRNNKRHLSLTFLSSFNTPLLSPNTGARLGIPVGIYAIKVLSQELIYRSKLLKRSMYWTGAGMTGALRALPWLSGDGVGLA